MCGFPAADRSDFVSLDEWLAFNYTSPCRRTGIPKTVTFPGSSVFLPGNFVLIYFGSDDSVLGERMTAWPK